jgi:small subunit ribosomal protein S17
MDRNKRKTRVGLVVSNRMQKTIVVAIDRLLRHPQYNRVIKRTSKLYAHDEKNQCQIGDKVLVMETRPLSKLKRWRLVEVLEKAQ